MAPKMDEGPTEEDKANALAARIKAPLQWLHHPSGVRVEDLQEKRFDDALEFMQKYFLNSEIPFKTTDFEHDEESVENFLENARIQMKDKASLIAVDDLSDRLLALAICRVNDRAAYSRTLSKLRFYQGKAYETVMKFYSILEKSIDIHKDYNSPKYMKIYFIVIHPRFRKKGFYKKMIFCCKKAAFSAGISVVMGIFTSGISQEAASSQGMVRLEQIYYQQYTNEEKQQVFPDPGSGNYGATVMAVRTTPESLRAEETEVEEEDLKNENDEEADEKM